MISALLKVKQNFPYSSFPLLFLAMVLLLFLSCTKVKFQDTKASPTCLHCSVTSLHHINILNLGTLSSALVFNYYAAFFYSVCLEVSSIPCLQSVLGTSLVYFTGSLAPSSPHRYILQNIQFCPLLEFENLR